MTSAMTLHNDVRIGVQIIVEGEKLDMERLITLLTLFLELIIPTMLATQAGIIVIKDISKAWSINPIRKDISILYYGILLLTILIGVLTDETRKIRH